MQIIEKLDGPIKNYATPSGLKRAWIVQDNYKEIIAEHQKKLNKPFWQFRNKAFDIVCTQEEFNELFGKEEKKKYDEKKLCRTMGIGMAVISILILIMELFEDVLPVSFVYISVGIILIDCLVIIIVSNTICKKQMRMLHRQ